MMNLRAAGPIEVFFLATTVVSSAGEAMVQQLGTCVHEEGNVLVF